MPATEQTWRDQRLLHVLFAVTGVAMLGATVWMFAADHTREWKGTQRTYVDIETRQTAWRDQAAAAEVEEKHEALMSRLLAVRSQPAPPSAIEEFQNRATREAERLGEQPPENLPRIQTLVSLLNEQARKAQPARQLVADVRALLDRQRALEQAQAGETAAAAQSPADPAAGAPTQKEIAAQALELTGRTEGELAQLLEAASQTASEAADALSGEDRQAAAAAVQEVVAALAQAFQRADQIAVEAETAAAEVRDDLITELRNVVAAARYDEDYNLRFRKFTAAEYDEARAQRDLAVRDNRPAEIIAQAQAAIDRKKAELDDWTLRYQAASDHRRALQEIVGRITAEEDAVQKEIADNRADQERLRKTIEEQKSTFFVSSPPYLGKRWLELPILDAFNSPRKINNLWTEGLTIQYGSFSKVRRFDRCTTCHQAIDKTLPGSAVEPGYEHEEDLQLVMLTPSKEEQQALRNAKDEQGQPLPFTTDRVYGFQLAQSGLVRRDDVTVSFVRNESRAARASLVSTDGSSPQPAVEILDALMHTQGWNEGQTDAPRPGLMLGDVIVRINNTVVRDREEAERMLLETARWGEPLVLTVRRGLPHPFASHPRLDLFVGSLSPHPMMGPNGFGCTICHEGQGSATAFKWASHTPNTPLEAERWREEHGWFLNHHWIFPMYPERFAESTCLKCHHDVTELEPSERFPDPPAPKVVKGHELIATYGCFGCHEINGFDGPNRRVGPDLRLEPNYYAAAQQLLAQIPSREQMLSQKAEQARQALQEATAEGGLLQGVDLSNLEQLRQQREALEAELAQAPAPEAEAQERLTQIRNLLPHLALATETDRRLQTLDELSQLAAYLVDRPDADQQRRELHRLITEDIALAQGELAAVAAAGEPSAATTADATELAEVVSALGADSHKLEPIFKDVEVPGKMRKAGPALRYLASKDDEAFLLDWINNPRHFRPSTRMPKFFGMHGHLHPHTDGHGSDLPEVQDEESAEEGRTAVETAQDFEPIEVLGMTEYLLAKTQPEKQPFEYLTPPEGILLPTQENPAPEEQIARGKTAFETRGCLACHTHDAFPEATAYRHEGDLVQGPDLSGIGSKFDPAANPNGPSWLYTWVKEPTRYHPRTKMPDLFLDPYEDGEGNVIDPAADIVAFLVSAKKEGWTPHFEEGFELQGDSLATPRAQQALRDLTLEYLGAAFSQTAAQEYYDEGVPAELRSELKGAEVELILPEGGQSGTLTDRQRLVYIGAKAIGKYGCYGCHDIPGFEDAKPIGTTLADWGRKDTSRLAFEHITHYLHGHGGHQANGTNGTDASHEPHTPHPEAEEMPDFYQEAIHHNHREGFIFQKLREPRSYDFEKADNKTYNEWLRMPQFPFNNQEREEVITFVLGLIADPPTTKFVYQPDPRERAIQEGRRVLAKYNCGGCHTLEMEKWSLTFPADAFQGQPPATTFSFVEPHFTPQELAAARQEDRRGMLHGMLVGQPAVDDTGMPIAYDEFGDPAEPDEDYDPRALHYGFQIFKPTILGEHVYAVGPTPVQVPARLIDKKYPAHGGYLARYLIPRVTELERQVNPQAKASEAWGWVPPPLVGEGNKVQPEWLYNFLLNPYPIRPAVFLRMPKFNMSPDEAQALVDYFAAKDNAAYPYDYLALRQPGVLESKDQAYTQGSRLDDAMKIVTNTTGCVKCHLVSDFAPQGSPRALAPDLADVYRRLRADYVRPWIAKPTSILPYTPMPENIHPQTGFAVQGLYHGSPEEQLDGLVDLLMNYDTFARRKTSIADLVQAANPTPPPAGENAPPAPGEEAAGEGDATGAAAETGSATGSSAAR